MYREIKSILKEDKLSYACRLQAIERLLANIPANYESNAMEFAGFDFNLNQTQQARPSRSLRQPKNRGQLEQPTIEATKQIVSASTRKLNPAISSDTNTSSLVSHREAEYLPELSAATTNSESEVNQKSERSQDWEKVVERRKKMIEMHAF